jgi:hypothetical protein
MPNAFIPWRDIKDGQYWHHHRTPISTVFTKRAKHPKLLKNEIRKLII